MDDVVELVEVDDSHLFKCFAAVVYIILGVVVGNVRQPYQYFLCHSFVLQQPPQVVERLGVFAYSQEEDTPAYPLGDPIRTSEKNRRVEEIMGLQEEISLAHNENLADKVIKVLIDYEEDGFYVGRSEFDSPDVDNTILMDKNEKLDIGNFYPVRIDQADRYDLYGTVIKPNKEA